MGQGAGSDDLWKFLPTTMLCASHKTEGSKTRDLGLDFSPS